MAACAAQTAAFHERFKGRLSVITRTGGHIRIQSDKTPTSRSGHEPFPGHRSTGSGNNQDWRKNTSGTNEAQTQDAAIPVSKPTVSQLQKGMMAELDGGMKPEDRWQRSAPISRIIEGSSQNVKEKEQTLLVKDQIAVTTDLDRPAHRKTYKPYSIRDYKQLPDRVDLGKLGPDLDNQDLIQKRQTTLRMMEFSRAIRIINLNNMKAANASSSRQNKILRSKPKIIQPSSRQKALQFAATIPVPHVRYKTKERSNVSRKLSLPNELEQLSTQHEQGRDKVEAIRRELGLKHI